MVVSDVISLVALLIAVLTVLVAQRRNGNGDRKIAELEALVSALRKRIESLERMYVDALTRESDLRKEVEKLEQELRRARDRIRELEKRLGGNDLRVLAIYPNRDDITNPAPAMYDAGVDYVLLTGRVRREDVVLALEERGFDIVEVDAHGMRTEVRGGDVEVGGILLSDGIAEAGWWARVMSRYGVDTVVVMACETLDVARAMKRAGIRRVIAVHGEILDTAAFTFVKNFYAALASGDNVEEAFRVARLTLSREEADKIWLL